MTSRRFVGAIVVLTVTAVSLALAQGPAPKQQEVFAPYWTSEPGWDTELELKNNLSSGLLTVTPVLRLASGEEIPLDPVTIAPNDSVSAWTNEQLLKHAPNLLSQPGSYGSVVFRFTSAGAMNLYARAVPLIQGQPIAFPVRAHPARDFESAPSANATRTLDGLWWQPRQGMNDVFVIANSSGKGTNAVLSIFDASGKGWGLPLSLGSHQTQRLSVSDLLQRSSLGGSYGGIELSFAATATGIDAVHFMYDEVGKSSMFLEMLHRDPITPSAKSGDYGSAMIAPTIALSAPDPALGIPASVALRPTVFLRNASARKISVSMNLSWRGDSRKGGAKLLPVELAPLSVQQLQLATLQKQLGIPDDAHWAMVTLATNASPGDLIAFASSRDASWRYGFESRFINGSGREYAGGELRADASHNHFIAVTNSGQKPADALLTLHYDEGRKSYEMHQTIQPGDQMWINLAQLIRQRIPDRNGETLPVDLGLVTYDVHELTAGDHSLLASELATDSTWGSQISPACPICCSYDSIVFDPTALAMQSGNTDDVAIDGVGSCSGDPVVLTDTIADWSSGNTGVATVSRPGVTGVGPGETDAYAQGNIPWPGECACNYKLVEISLPVTVQVPTDSKIVTQISSFAMSTTSTPACPSGQAGWYRQVQKIVTDQYGDDITTDGSIISESLGLTSTNQLNLAAPNPFAPVATSGGGYFNDQFGFCSPLCPASTGQTDLNETFTDEPSVGGPYTLKTHTLAYTCKGDTDNGK